MSKSQPTGVEHPRVFISYAWTDEVFSERVLALATRLREDGVDAIIDKWDLNPGEESAAFMERMVTDPEVQKVLIVSNETYVEKANKRIGGAGTEAQIISPEVFKTAKNAKFVVVAFELDDDNNAYIPAFYTSRIYINLASDQGYEDEYDRLIRWIYEKPLHRKPQLGARPAHLIAEDPLVISTHSAFMRASEALRLGKPNSVSSLRAYLEVAMTELQSVRLESRGDVEFDQKVLDSIDALKPLVGQIGDLTSLVAHAENPTSGIDAFQRFLEQLLSLSERPSSVMQWHEWDFDNFRFIAHEVILCMTATIIREEQFHVLDDLLKRRFVIPNSNNNKQFSSDFSSFYKYNRSIEHRNARLKLNKYSLHASILHDRYASTRISFDEILQSDVCLFLRDCAIAMRGQNLSPSWYPITTVYVEDGWRPLALFARAESAAYANKIAKIFGVRDGSGIKEIVDAVIEKGWVPKRHYFTVDLKTLTNYDRLGMYADLA